MLVAALPFALAATGFASLPVPTAVLQMSCRHGECVWQRWQRIETLRDAAGEKLLKITSRRGISVHRDRIPQRYSKAIPVDWTSEPRVEYVLCSMKRPTTVFRSEDEYVVTPIQMRALAGYEYAAATIYLAACHARAPGKWREADIARLGYQPGIGGQQLRFATLDEVMRSLD